MSNLNGWLATLTIVILYVDTYLLRKRVQKLEVAVRELNPGLDI